MNGLAPVLHVSDCPLKACGWLSDPLGSSEAATEARRSHLNGHTHGELVDHVAAMNPKVAEYTRAEDARD